MSFKLPALRSLTLFSLALNAPATVSALMIDVLNAIGVEFVVLGNHEFDFGSERLAQLLRGAAFTCFGSNIRERKASHALFAGLVDYQVVSLPSGLALGLFGVSTTVTGNDPFAGDAVVFEPEVAHARRCVDALQALGADAIVALTHMKIADDKILAAQVPGIHVVLGGHDHEIMSICNGDTLIHKSGQNAQWLGAIGIAITKTDATYDKSTTVTIDLEWQMLCNRGYAPDPTVLALVQAYSARVHAELDAAGKLVPLAIARTALDGTRLSCRTRETNMGDLVADALRDELHADVAVVHAGFIKGDALHDAGVAITEHWLETFLPQRKPTIVVEMSVRDLTRALTHMLRKYPQMSSAFPQVAGIELCYDASAQQITSARIAGCDAMDESASSRLVRVATVLVPTMDAWSFFADATRLTTGPIVRALVSAFVKTHRGGEVAYPANGQRLVIQD